MAWLGEDQRRAAVVGGLFFPTSTYRLAVSRDVNRIAFFEKVDRIGMGPDVRLVFYVFGFCSGGDPRASF